MELQDVEVVTEGLAFPEGPVVLGDGSVLVVEIEAGRLTRVAPDGTRTTAAQTGGGPNGAARGPDGAIYVCNNGGWGERIEPCIQRVELESGKVEVLYTSAGGHALRSPNDLVFDRAGNLWFTDPGANAICYAAPDGSSIKRVITEGIYVPNGIGLSPDESILYWAQTFTRQVQRRRLTAPGEVVPSLGHTFVAWREGAGDPWALLAGLPGAQELDSLAVDSSGAVCVGTITDPGITVVSPDGEVEKHTLPEALADGAVTNIAIGGTDLSTAYITASLTGRLLSCRWPRPGLRLNFQEEPAA
jgi:gluconolactonase